MLDLLRLLDPVAQRPYEYGLDLLRLLDPVAQRPCYSNFSFKKKEKFGTATGSPGPSGTTKVDEEGE